MEGVSYTLDETNSILCDDVKSAPRIGRSPLCGRIGQPELINSHSLSPSFLGLLVLAISRMRIGALRSAIPTVLW